MKKTDIVMKIVPALVFAAILVYLGVYVYRAVDDPFETSVASLYTVYDSVETRGVVVRNEEWLIYSGGVVSLTAKDGERVSAGGEIAAVYPDGDSLKKAERIAFVTAQIDHLDALAAGKKSEDPLDYDSRIKTLARTLRAEADSRDMMQLSGTAMELCTLVFNRDGSGDIDQQLGELTTELRSLGSAQELRMTTIFAAASGIFYSHADGWEALTPDFAAALTPSGLAALIEETRRTPAAAVGKLIYGTEWYFMALVPEAEAATLAKGDGIDVSFGRWLADTARMTVSSISTAENGYCAVLLSCSQSMAEAAPMRVQTAELIRSSYEGIRVTRKALHTDGSEDFVYVVTGLRAERKTVNILSDTGDFYVIQSEPNRADAVHPGDVVIVTGKGLYDGKVVE